jgi:hypothetical protein
VDTAKPASLTRLDHGCMPAGRGRGARLADGLVRALQLRIAQSHRPVSRLRNGHQCGGGGRQWEAGARRGTLRNRVRRVDLFREHAEAPFL